MQDFNVFQTCVYTVANSGGNVPRLWISPPRIGGLGGLSARYMGYPNSIGLHLIHHAMGRAAFDLFDQIGNRHICRKPRQKMSMILNPTDRHHTTSQLITLIGNHVVNLFFDVGRNKRQPIPSCPNQMHIKLRKISPHST